jgi:hypothetical protein
MSTWSKGAEVRAPVFGVAAAVTVVLVAALGLSADTGERLVGAGPAAPSTSPAKTVPVLSTPCQLGGPTGRVFLTVDQAKELTTAAAAVVQGRTPRARFAATVAVRLGQPAPVTDSVTATLLGSGTAERLSCRVFRDSLEVEPERRSGLTARAERVRKAFRAKFGRLPDGGFAPGGITTGHVDNSSHYDGRAIDVFFRPVGNAAQTRRGWVFAQWVAAHADDYDVLSVIYSDHIWTSWASTAGWRDYVHPSGNRTNPILRHLDHVHVAVESGHKTFGR